VCVRAFKKKIEILFFECVCVINNKVIKQKFKSKMSKITMMVNEGVVKGLESSVLSASLEAVRMCAAKYGFDAEEAGRELGLCCSVVVKGKSVNVVKEKAVKKSHPKYPVPFQGVVCDSSCQGIKLNHGLYTQCTNGNKVGDSFCGSCAKQCSKNENGEPDLGLIGHRVLKGDDYRDPKGRGAVHYTKVLSKQKLTREMVCEEAEKFGLTIEEHHFVAPDVKRGRPKKAVSDSDSDSGVKKARGRPKKENKVVEVDATEDLFASLMIEASNTSTVEKEDDEVSELSCEDEILAPDAVKEVKEVVSQETKNAVKLAKQEEKLMKEADKAAKQIVKDEEKAAKLEALEQEKALKLAEKAEAKAVKDAEKAAKDQEKAVKDAEKLAAKVIKDAEKAVKAEAKAVKDAEKAAKLEAKLEAKALKEAEVVVETPILEKEEEEEEEEVVTVKKFEHNGVTYLRSSNNTLYNKDSDPVGIWNELTQSIDLCELDSEEEEEDDDDNQVTE
jgi:hypothetical protein